MTYRPWWDDGSRGDGRDRRVRATEGRVIRIVITSRTDDVHAAIADHPGLWGCGKTQYEAVGNLVMAHRELHRGIRR
jgi:hypothetical protein